jgi:hypothetical protein
VDAWTLEWTFATLRNPCKRCLRTLGRLGGRLDASNLGMRGEKTTPIKFTYFGLRPSDFLRISSFGIRICEAVLRSSCRHGTAWYAQWDGQCDGLGHLWDGFGTPNGTARILNVCRAWDGGTPDLPPCQEKTISGPVSYLLSSNCCYLLFPEWDDLGRLWDTPMGRSKSSMFPGLGTVVRPIYPPAGRKQFRVRSPIS